MIKILLITIIALTQIVSASENDSIQKKDNIETSGKNVIEVASEFSLALIKNIPQKSVIAVLPFEDKTNSNASTTISEAVVSEIIKADNYSVVERSKLDKAIDEITLSQTGLTDKEIEMGKMMTADYLVTGSITDAFGKRLISGTIVKVQTGETINAVQMILSSDKVSDLNKEILKEKSSPMSYVSRSLLLPGWGQMYGGRNVKGGIFMAAGLGSLGFTIYKWVDTGSKNQEYENFSNLPNNKDEYDEWKESTGLEDVEDINAYYLQEQTAYYDEYSQSHDVAIIMTSVTAGIWVINVIDAYFVGVSESNKVTRYFSYVQPREKGFLLSFNF